MSTQIIAPVPGIFYRRPAPDKAPFVEQGDAVEAGQTIGVIEIMKQFTEVRSEAAGVLDSFAVEDFGMVGPGDVIATIN
ncbi:biotin carboxyl carrier domain-containing protein [Leucobacter coleopterorum]|uniref:Biotin carboxyl carrier protein of acetyl-CoA carboxylase n=1 Tax=Leucobacter coleopterorum TaxID=2714933 RepID=A0ABX6JYW0_9MICO|nr:acetyl-CoA carboxylase [Leucobacter coleopterorum]QIM19510.1 biotin carboxyl carrier domain-containing protein [Leucobacter coleopterorum]